MPTWSDILNEIVASVSPDKPPEFDRIRRKYLAEINRVTGRDTILYATRWTQGGQNISPEFVSIVDEDLQGLMEVIYGLNGPNLDLILHSPGGSLDAAEAFVQYIRSKFSNIRVIVPQLAMSAATMIACAADVIVLGKHSFLGPTDPQFFLQTPLGPRMVPAQAILAQFEQAKEACKDPSALGAWLPMLNQYGPDILVQCENVSVRAKSIVATWLRKFMFKDDADGATKAESVAEWLSTHENFQGHGRHISRDDICGRLTIENLEDNPIEQDLFLSVFHATTHTFCSTQAVKIIENHNGRAFIKHQIAPQ